MLRYSIRVNPLVPLRRGHKVKPFNALKVNFQRFQVSNKQKNVADFLNFRLCRVIEISPTSLKSITVYPRRMKTWRHFVRENNLRHRTAPKVARVEYL